MKILISAGVKSGGLYSLLTKKFSDGSIDFASENLISNLSNYLSKGGTADRIIVTMDGLTNDGAYTAQEIYLCIKGLIDTAVSVLDKVELVFYVKDSCLADMIYSETYTICDRVKILLLLPDDTVDLGFLSEMCTEAISKFDSNMKIGNRVYKPKVIDYSNQQTVDNNNFIDGDTASDLDETDEISDEQVWEDNTCDIGDDSLEDIDDTDEEDIDEVETNEIYDSSNITDSLLDNMLDETDDSSDDSSDNSLFDTDINDNFDNIDDGFNSIESEGNNSNDTASNVDNSKTTEDSTDSNSNDTDTSETDEDSTNDGDSLTDSNSDNTVDNTNDTFTDDSFSEADDLFEENTDNSTETADNFSETDDLFDENQENSTELIEDDSLFADSVEEQTLEPAVENINLDNQINLDTNSNIVSNSTNKKEKKSLFGIKKQDKPTVKNNSNKNIDYTELYNVLNSYNRRGHLILVSGASNTGKTTVAGNIANILAKLNHSVALVDFDLSKRGQLYLNKDAFNAVRYDDNYSNILMKAINNKSTSISACGAIVREGLHLFGTSIAEDTPTIESIVPDKSNVRDFIYSLKTVYNFIVVDCPMEYLGDKLSELVIGADTIILNVEDTNKSLSEFTMELVNIDDYKVRRDIFSRANVLFNKSQTNSGVALNYKYKNYKELMSILDRHIFDSTGYETGGIFSGINILGSMPTIKELDSLILSSNYISDTKIGKDVYLRLLNSLFVK